MIGRIAAAAMIGLLLSGQAALAGENARIGAVSGTVMISQGGRFASASSGAVLRTGDRVVASNGSAKVVYADGCNVVVSARSMATVSATSPCAGGSSNVVKVATTENGERRGAWAYNEQRGLWVWVGFGVLSAAALAAAIDDDSKPTSP